MDWTTLDLTQAEADAVNSLCRWLGPDDLTAAMSYDAIILAGTSALPTLEAACVAARDSGKPLWLAGGIGHSTRYLVDALRNQPRYAAIKTEGQPEARILAAMAGCWEIPQTQCFIEAASTNTGENAAFTRRMMAGHDFHPRRVLLIQDPLLQRRTGATFAFTWRDEPGAPVFINWPGWQLRIEPKAQGWGAVDYQMPWDADRFFALMMGEIPRLRNDENGYGPRGHGFIGEVIIPPDVEQAWQLLRRRNFGVSRL